MVMREQFQQVIDAYNSLPCKPMKISRKRHDFVQLWADNWPLKPTKTIEGAVHYEFLDMGEEITIEIHLEASAVAGLAKVMQPWVMNPRPLLEDIFLAQNVYDWDNTWFPRRKGGRFGAGYALNDPQHCAEAMARFICATQPKITEWLNHNNLLINKI
ncbi:MAG: hypothetical protein BWK73_32640 [Thiothrix lacustris]|uniref:Uncharacterized protein n=1 Tax=Thiothrix lacustris TaxID=525917 RepID=A0A1Y1QHF5_9GAMM|nr:MAG: hypothetical protein BWK73_32640 [Thiothrix lacustris]